MCVSAAGQLRALRREGRGGGRGLGLRSAARMAAGGGSGSRRRVAAGDVDQGEEHAEQGGEADGEGDRPHAAGAPPRRQAQEEAHDRGREAYLQPAQGKEASNFPPFPLPSWKSALTYFFYVGIVLLKELLSI